MSDTLTPHILHEDQDVLVIEKPPQVVVNDAQTVNEPTIQSWLRAHEGQDVASWPSDWATLVPSTFSPEYGTPEQIFAQRGGIVHRLDKETSGVLLLAKHPGALVALLQQFQQRQVAKTYVCLTHGHFAIASDTLSLPMQRSSANRTRFAVHPLGRSAMTAYEVLQQFVEAQEGTTLQHPRSETQPLEKFSLVQCQPHTGRTHQIRVHMAHVNHPIVSDPEYTSEKRLRDDARWCPRLFLHASVLSFTHPRTRTPLRIESPLPADLQSALTHLQPV
jgi:23S rRNA pseudouridine1911/1915/1917 synthase